MLIFAFFAVAIAAGVSLAILYRRPLFGAVVTGSAGGAVIAWVIFGALPRIYGRLRSSQATPPIPQAPKRDR